MTYSSFKEMPVWQRAHEISIRVFEITIKLPKSEDYGLTSQIRRSANSIAGNIAEGFGRKTIKDKNNFYTIARGSAFETQNHLLYGNAVEYFTTETTNSIFKDLDNIIKELNTLMKSLNDSQPQP